MEILRKLNKIEKHDRKGLKKAIDAALVEEVSDDFDNFVEGLDLTEDDKFWILGGMVSRKTEGLADPDVMFKFLDKVLDCYKTNKGVKKCSRRISSR
jgi:hypothetical protein